MPGGAWEGSAWRKEKKELLYARFRTFVCFIGKRKQ